MHEKGVKDSEPISYVTVILTLQLQPPGACQRSWIMRNASNVARDTKLSFREAFELETNPLMIPSP